MAVLAEVSGSSLTLEPDILKKNALLYKVRRGNSGRGGNSGQSKFSCNFLRQNTKLEVPTMCVTSSSTKPHLILTRSPWNSCFAQYDLENPINTWQ